MKPWRGWRQEGEADLLLQKTARRGAVEPATTVAVEVKRVAS